MPFKPGQSGNPGGRRKPIFSEALIRHLHLAPEQKGKGKKDTKLDAITKKLIELAQQGEIAAIKEVADRIEGKSDASLNLQHSGSIAHEHEAISTTTEWLMEITSKHQEPSPEKPVLN